jgi:molecular chaperone GrpE
MAENENDRADVQGVDAGLPSNRSATENESSASNAANPVESGAEASASPQTAESLLAEVEALRAEKDEQFRGWQRTQADFVNYRRRAEQERADLVKLAEAGLIRDLLPVLDDLERALANLPPELRGLTWVDGILLIERKLAAVLEAHGLTPIDALGKEFDPHQHDAVLREGEPSAATIVTGELQKGYRLHDQVLRPTLVKVGEPFNSNVR